MSADTDEPTRRWELVRELIYVTEKTGPHYAAQDNAESIVAALERWLDARDQAIAARDATEPTERQIYEATR